MDERMRPSPHKLSAGWAQPIRPALLIMLLRRLGEFPGCGQHFVGAGADADVFGEVAPADDFGGVDQKFGGAGDVALIRASRLMQNMIAPNHRGVRIGKNGEGISGFCRQIARNFRRVDADRYREYACSLEVRQPLFYAS